MTSTQRLEIAFSKGKLVKILAGSIAFVLIGLWILIFQPAISVSFLDNIFIINGVAIGSILSFGFVMVYCVRKLNEKKPGIVIDDSGIFDNSTAIAVGLIPWTEVKEIVKIKVLNQHFVVIRVSNPETYIARERNFLKKKSLEYNYRNYRSPVAISANGLKCNLDELMKILQKKLEEYRMGSKY